MAVTSISRIVAPSLAIVAASGAALFFGVTHLRGKPPVEPHGTIAAAAVLPPASGDRDGTSAAPAQAKVNAAATVLGGAPDSAGADQSAPAFDVARIDRSGDAVIAGRAAPGAVVELLRNGERHDRAVADPSGQFVMVPPRLPAGSYELTLRSRQPDGTQATSEQRVAVALNDPDSVSGTIGSPAAARPDIPVPAGPSRQPQHFAAADAAPLPERAESPAAGSSGTTTMVVTRGDNLWRISRVTYGTGLRYAVVYRANRFHIRNPDLIYPGQVFVLPAKAR